MTQQQDEYARKNRDLHEYQKALIKAVREADKQLQNDPRFQKFGAIPMVKAYVRNPQGKGKAILYLVDLIIEDKTCSQTNKTLLEKAQPEFPDIPLRGNLFSQKLHKGVLKNIQSRINGNMREPISIKKCKSLSDVRKQVKVAYLGNSRSKTFKTTIIFTTEALIVNNKPFPYSMKTAKGNEYVLIKFKRKKKSYEIRAMALRRLLDKAFSIT